MHNTTQIHNELLGKICSWPTQTRNHYLLAITKSMTILIRIGQRQNSCSSYLTSCGKQDSVFKLSECKQASECKFPMRSGAGAGVTFAGTRAGVKQSDTGHLWSLAHGPRGLFLLSRHRKAISAAANQKPFVNKDLCSRKSVKRTIRHWEPNTLFRLGNL